MFDFATTLYLAIALGTPLASAAGAHPHLDQVPVAHMQSVAPATFAAAAAVAERGGTPIEIALAIAGAFDGATQQVIQVNAGSEAPSASHVTVLRDGLLDDSVRGERWEVTLKRTPSGRWEISEVKRAWRCRRGELPDRFATVRCP